MPEFPPLEVPKPTIQSADGTLIWAATAGRKPDEAPVLMLVPGICCASLCFQPQFQDPTLLAKFCLITYEPRGQGRSGQPLESEAYSSQRNAEDFKAVCDAYGAKKVFLAGWSYGGLVPCDVYAHLGPDWIAGVIYLAGLPWRAMLPEIENPVLWDAVNIFLADDVLTFSRGCEAFFESCFYEPNYALVPYTSRAAMIGAGTTQNPIARKLLLTAREQDPTKLLEQADSLEVILIVGDKDDHIIGEKIIAFLKKTFTRFESTLLKDVGHAVAIEASDEVNKIMTAFIERVLE